MEINGLQSESLKVFINEIGEEIGISNYVNNNKAKFPSYYHGAIGGTSSKLCNLLGQKIISETSPDQVKDLMNKYDLHVTQEVIDKVNELR